MRLTSFLATGVSYYNFALILFHEVKFHNRKNSYSLTQMLAVVCNGVRRLHRELVGQLNEVEDNCESTNVCGQSHYIEVAQVAIFKQNMRFGLILGQLVILKKKVGGPVMSNFEGSFFMFSGVNEIFFFQKYPSVKRCIKYLESKMVFCYHDCSNVL